MKLLTLIKNVFFIDFAAIEVRPLSPYDSKKYQTIPLIDIIKNNETDDPVLVSANDYIEIDSPWVRVGLSSVKIKMRAWAAVVASGTYGSPVIFYFEVSDWPLTTAPGSPFEYRLNPYHSFPTQTGSPFFTIIGQNTFLDWHVNLSGSRFGETYIRLVGVFNSNQTPGDDITAEVQVIKNSGEELVPEAMEFDGWGDL